MKTPRLVYPYSLARPLRARLNARDRANIFCEFSRLAQIMDREVQRSIPYLLFDAIVDKLCRSNHSAVNGGIAPATWTGWNRLAAPLGKGCRCTLVGLSSVRARKMLESGSPYFDLTVSVPAGAGPDLGWERRPGWWEKFAEECRAKGS